MPARLFEFTNPAGQQLTGRLELPAGQARGWAVLAHCFTCGKDSLAAVRISRALAGEGIGVLRFDFAGLGQSEGEFADSTFGSNVDDVVAAADAMRSAGMPAALLVGHSLGGAAVLSAATRLPDAVGVATIGAPFDLAHVLQQFDPAALERIDSQGRATAMLGGRAFDVSRSLVNSFRHQDQGARIAALRCAVLVLHGPRDQIVGIDQATKIFLAARHPKSFVSLGQADHLLSDRRDADYAAAVIAGWATRYLPDPVPVAAAVASETNAVAEETGLGKFQLQMDSGGARWLADEPQTVGGLGSGPTPYDLLAAALAACTTMTLRHYADRRGWPVRRITTAVGHHKDKNRVPADLFARRIAIEGDVDEAQRAELLAAAERCPVHKTLMQGSQMDAVTSDTAKDFL